MREEHGMKDTAEWRAWRNMKRRCDSPCRADYHRYGGRGISVCPEWLHSFEQFYQDMGPRPSPSHTLDRIDNDGDYTPDNCEWRTRREQAQNRSTNRHLTCNGHTHTIAEWSEISGIHRDTIISRLKVGWSIKAALGTPAGKTTSVVGRMDINVDTTKDLLIKEPCLILETGLSRHGEEEIRTLGGLHLNGFRVRQCRQQP